ncbi:MAG TPA: hypothetical protein VNO20_05745 [Solirubrobacterales bacterium]|nr:hypothetical protein [Solirubrobacterales bacterium]
MKRIRNLGLAIAMALALTASVGAASASASYFSFDEYPANVSGKAVGTPVITFSGGRTATCPGSPFTEQYSAPTEKLTPGSMLDSKCSTYEGNATLEVKNCKFIFHPGAETNPGEFTGTFEIGPFSCGSMVLNGPTCDRFFGAQGGLSATYDNEGEGSKAAVAIDATTTGIAYTVVGPEGFCGKGVQYATYDGSWQVTATNAEGASNGVRVETLGLYMAGEKSEDKAKQPRIEAESYPVNVAGRQDPADKHVLTFHGGRTVKCEEVDFSSGTSAATTQLALGAKYVGCKATLGGSTIAASVTMNSCHFALGVLNAGPAYAGSLGVTCGKEGDGIEVSDSICAYKISPQAGLEGVGLATFGAGAERGIAVDLGVKGISYTRTKGNVTNCGEKTGVTASYVGGSTLHALQ